MSIIRGVKMYYTIKIDKYGRVTAWNGYYDVLLGHGMEVFVACVHVAKSFEKGITIINEYDKELAKW